MNQKGNMLPTSAVARMLGVSTDKVVRLAKSGRLRSYQTLSRRYFFDPADVDRYLQQYGRPGSWSGSLDSPLPAGRQLNPTEVAKILGLHPSSVIALAKRGQLPHTVGANGFYRFDEQSVVQFKSVRDARRKRSQ